MPRDMPTPPAWIINEIQKKDRQDGDRPEMPATPLPEPERQEPRERGGHRERHRRDRNDTPPKGGYLTL